MVHNRAPPSSNDAGNERDVKHLRRLSWLLDNSIPLPGGYRIGLDGIVGLIPGTVRDALGASLSTYIVVQAARLGASPVQLLRMMMNILLETVMGTIPVLGDLFKFAGRPNQRNMALLDAQLQKAPAYGSARHRLTTASVVLLIAFAIMLLVCWRLPWRLVLGTGRSRKFVTPVNLRLRLTQLSQLHASITNPRIETYTAVTPTGYEGVIM